MEGVGGSPPLNCIPGKKPYSFSSSKGVWRAVEVMLRLSLPWA